MTGSFGRYESGKSEKFFQQIAAPYGIFSAKDTHEHHFSQPMRQADPSHPSHSASRSWTCPSNPDVFEIKRAEAESQGCRQKPNQACSCRRMEAPGGECGNVNCRAMAHASWA
jgi:hypothetical protein